MAVATGYYHTLVLAGDGTVRFAGTNDQGQMGMKIGEVALSFVDIVEGGPWGNSGRDDYCLYLQCVVTVIRVRMPGL